MGVAVSRRAATLKHTLMITQMCNYMQKLTRVTCNSTNVYSDPSSHTEFWGKRAHVSVDFIIGQNWGFKLSWGEITSVVVGRALSNGVGG